MMHVVYRNQKSTENKILNCLECLDLYLMPTNPYLLLQLLVLEIFLIDLFFFDFLYILRFLAIPSFIL